MSFRTRFYRMYEACVLIVFAGAMVFLTEERTGKELTWNRTSASKARTNNFPTVVSLKGAFFIVFSFFLRRFTRDRQGGADRRIGCCICE